MDVDLVSDEDADDAGVEQRENSDGRGGDVYPFELLRSIIDELQY